MHFFRRILNCAVYYNCGYNITATGCRLLRTKGRGGGSATHKKKPLQANKKWQKDELKIAICRPHENDKWRSRIQSAYHITSQVLLQFPVAVPYCCCCCRCRCCCVTTAVVHENSCRATLRVLVVFHGSPTAHCRAHIPPMLWCFRAALVMWQNVGYFSYTRIFLVISF